MPSKKDMLLQMLQGGLEKGIGVGSAGALKNMEGEQDLAKLLKSDELKQGELQREMEMAKGLAGQYKGQPVRAGGVSIGSPEDPRRFQLQLTPAQESAERAAGKQIADFDAAGGRPAQQKNLEALKQVQEDLAGGKRDQYDRIVGGALNSMPTLMGLLAPTEKARRDRARSTIGDMVRRTDANPTQQQIEAISGQVYDPSADNANLQSRIDAFAKEQQSKADQMEQASSNYKRSGYATIGSPGMGQPAPAAPARITISNGAETLEIDASDLASAEAEGYKRIK